MSPSRPSNAFRLLVAGLLVGGSACVGAELDEVSATDQEVRANPGSTIAPSREANNFAGRYPEVMHAVPGLGCTGTVIAPYAVLTASHCGNQPWSVNWTGTGGSQAIAAVHANPYLGGPHIPSWWATLNAQQMATPGGRQDDWPAQHDQEVLFVPSLTPQFLRDHGITPAAIDPRRGAFTDYTLVGVGSTGGVNRDSIAQRFVAATPNTITQSPRDGYLSASQTAVNFGNADPGDSGGPTLGWQRYQWTDGTVLDPDRVVVGTVQNTGGDFAPLAYDPGITMTANQRLTVRVNALWAGARADDADGDGLPTACDANPNVTDPGGNLCPEPLGGPRGAATLGIPVAQLTCRPGYAAVGMRGRAGDLIDQLAVQCRALSCFENNDAGCAGNSYYEYWTDELGGSGGGAWDLRCPSGHVMVGVDATDNATGGWLHSIGPRCALYRDVVNGAPSPTTVNRAGNIWWGSFARRDCGAGQVLAGFQARSHDARFVTGVQPICSSDFVGFRTYMGGQGGGDAVLRCPVDYHAIGTVQHAEGGAINAFGLLCGPRQLRGDETPDSQLVVARGRYMHFGMWREVPAMVEPWTARHLPTGSVVARCPYRLAGIKARVGNVLERIDAVQCATGTLAPAFEDVSVNVGTASSTSVYRAQRCTFTEYVDALYSRAGWLTDGISLHCGR